MNNINPQQLNGLLSTVSKKLGTSPEVLKQQLESGKFDKALSGMSSADNAKFQQVLNNPQLLEKFVSAPQFKALYQKLTGGK